MRRLLLALVLSMLASTLAGCPFFTRDEPSSPGPTEPSAAPAADEHAGHDHP